MTSNANDLSARIRRRTETEDREMNELAARELQTFGETLRERVRHKLRTVETVMETEISGADRERTVATRDRVAERMTPADLSEAQRRAREWHAAH